MFDGINRDYVAELLSEDYKKNIELVSSSMIDVGVHDDVRYKLLYDILRKKKYVIKDVNTFNCDDVVLAASLVNNCKKTLKFIENSEFYKVNRSSSYNLTEYMCEELYNALKKNKFTIAKSNLTWKFSKKDILNGIPFIASLENDYQGTINELSLINYDLGSYRWDKKYRQRLKQILLRNNYVADKKNILSDNNVLAVSLINNYKKTLDLIDYRVEFDDENKRLVDIYFTDNKYVISSDDASYIEKCPQLLISSLKNNYKETCRNLFNDEGKNSILNNYFFSSLTDKDIDELEAIVNEKGKDTTLTNIASFIRIEKNRRMMSKCMSEKEIVEQFDLEGRNINLLPQGFFENERLLSLLVNDQEVVKFIKDELVSTSKYTKDNEVKLLKILNSNYDTLEEHFVSLGYKHRDDLSFLEIMSLGYYAKKVLSENHVEKEYKVNTFNYNTNNGFGNLDHSNHVIDLFNNSNNVRIMLNTINHECAHAVMFELVERADLMVDEDVEVYSKDIALRKILGDNYYYSNYNRISFENDAEFRALALDSHLFRNNSLDKKCDYLFDALLEEDKNYASKNNFYLKSNYRIFNNQEYHINDLFLMILKKTGDELVKDILNNYPSIGLEYNVTLNDENKKFTINRKSFEELVDLSLHCKDDVLREKYHILMMRRCDPSIEKIEEARENVKYLLGMSMGAYVKEPTDAREAKFFYNEAYERINNMFNKFEKKGMRKNAKVQK